MLPDLHPDIDSSIVANNIKAVQASYFAHQLESMRAFEVVDRLVELFQQGLLPLGAGKAGRLLKRYANTADRLSAQERQQLYARTLGVPGGAATDPQANHEFHSLWLGLVASVALFEHRQNAASVLALSRAASAAAVWRMARALAANASAHGATLTDSVKRVSIEANLLRAVLQAPEIQKAFGARDMWQVIEQVASTHLGGARNVARRRTLAHAGSAILQWLADHADALSKPAAPSTGITFPDSALIDPVQTWLAASREHDDATNWLALPSPSVQLWSLANELVRIMGIEAMIGRRGSLPQAGVQTHPHGMVALLCGPARTGKTLGAHALAAALSRDLVRVDLRQVVSKYVGETEKNLDAVLARVEHAGALLLLDEADALFGKRTDVQDSHDRYANAETGYLLQRLQAHRGMVILESKVLPAGAEGRAMAGLSHVVQFPR